MTWARTSSGSNRLMVEIDVLAVCRGFLTLGIGASPVFPDPRKPPVPPQPEARSPESDGGRCVSPEQLIPGAEDQLLYN